MIRKKICMVGSFAVGKTSLVARFVRSIFSETYQTTIGVKVDKKVVEIEGQEITLMLWDLHGEDEFQRIRESYLRGSDGYFLVIDPTRPATLEVALGLRERVHDAAGQIPCVLLANKVDIESEWEVRAERLAGLEAEGMSVIRTSAKSGEGVEEAFLELARRTLKRS